MVYIGAFVGWLAHSLTHSLVRSPLVPGEAHQERKEKARELEINYLLTFSMENQQRQLEPTLSDADAA